jgi:hypothetical protein
VLAKPLNLKDKVFIVGIAASPRDCAVAELKAALC